MENSTVIGLRSRSRSKTPFLRSSCDRENCPGGEEHATHKSGRKTPTKRNTPVKQLKEVTTSKIVRETITITEEVEPVSPPAHRTRLSARGQNRLVKTSDYSSEESLDRLRGHSKEIFQNELNNKYERVSSLADNSLSPIQPQTHSHNVTHERSERSRFGSPTYSASSTDSSFAEQALADTSVLLDRDPSLDHLPYKLYKQAGEYWNKYPKTDYTYSPLSKDRVELAPGQIAVPNMSRRSLSQFRIQGPNTSAEELQHLAYVTATTTRKRFTSLDSSDDESYLRPNGGYMSPRPVDERWWITRLLITVVTAITSVTSTLTDTVARGYRSIVGPAHRYPYTERNPRQASVASQAASVAAAPFLWMYTIIKKVVTTTVTTITETISPQHVGVSEKASARYLSQKTSKRRWWPWLLLLLLPLIGYGSHYTYENLDQFAIPNFTDIAIDMKEFTTNNLPSITLPSLPNISLPLPTISLPEINITLPDISDNLPEVSKTFIEYRDIVQNRVGDASEYMKVVAESCFEEVRRFWRGVLG